MMRLVSSFAILRVKIVVVRIRAVVLRIRTLVPKRRDESPHALSRRLLSLWSLFQKPAESTNAKKKRQRRRENTNFVRTKVKMLRENKTTERYNKKTWKKRWCSHYNSAYFQHAGNLIWNEREKRRRKREKRVEWERERDKMWVFVLSLRILLHFWIYILHVIIERLFIYSPKRTKRKSTFLVRKQNSISHINWYRQSSVAEIWSARSSFVVGNTIVFRS